MFYVVGVQMSLVKVPRAGFYLVYSRGKHIEDYEPIPSDALTKCFIKKCADDYKYYFPKSELTRIDFCLDFYSFGTRNMFLEQITTYNPPKDSFKIINRGENNESEQTNTLCFQE